VIFYFYNKVWKNFIPKLLEVIGRTKTKMYFQGTVCQMCSLAVPLTIKVGLTMAGNHAKQSIPKKTVFLRIWADGPTYSH
jgi:hypothetical protein